MEGFKDIIKGEVSFITGWITVIILNMILPGIIDAGESIYAGSDLPQIIWFFMIIIYVLLSVISPVYYIVKGMQEIKTENAFKNVFLALFFFIFNVLLTIKGWYAIEGFTSLTTDTFTLGLFWVGGVGVWIFATIITPAYIIIKSTQQ